MNINQTIKILEEKVRNQPKRMNYNIMTDVEKELESAKRYLIWQRKEKLKKLR